MSRAETGGKIFDRCNCAQSVIAAFSEDYGLEKDKALSVAAGFGGGIGRLQETCGAVTGAIMILGLASDFRDGDSRDKLNMIYDKTRSFIDDFRQEKGTVNCRELLGCDLMSEEGHKYFVENNLRENCRVYVKYACELLEKYLSR